MTTAWGTIVVPLFFRRLPLSVMRFSQGKKIQLVLAVFPLPIVRIALSVFRKRRKMVIL
jgi:hypothetical protein